MAPEKVIKPKKAKKAWMDNLESLITKQTASISSLTDKLSSYMSQSNTSDPPPAKRPKPSEDSSQPNKSDPPKTDSDDEFDKRYGHLFGSHINNDEETEHEDSGDENCEDDDNCEDENNNTEEDSDGESIDEDLLNILEKNPNWSNSSSIRKFIEKTIDRPLPEDMLKTITDSYCPKEDMQHLFTAPKMPRRLYKAMSRMRGKNALKTEQALYSAQSEIFIVAKPIIEALNELKPLGSQVSKSRELLSISLHGYYSVSLKISKARRSNVRFLFKEALAEVLYTYPPNHVSLFGGEDFSSQIEKAAKEAKLDFSWSAKQKKKQPFRAQNSKGFQRYNNNNNNNNRYNNQKSGNQKKKAIPNNSNKPKTKE